MSDGLVLRRGCVGCGRCVVQPPVAPFGAEGLYGRDGTSVGPRAEELYREYCKALGQYYASVRCGCHGATRGFVDVMGLHDQSSVEVGCSAEVDTKGDVWLSGGTVDGRCVELLASAHVDGGKDCVTGSGDRSGWPLDMGVGSNVDGRSDRGSVSFTGEGADCGSAGPDVVNSKRKEKNRRRRERRRVAKSVSGAVVDSDDVPEWRRRGPRAVGSEVPLSSRKSAGFVGYFDGLSEDVKLELKESRARRLIAENKRKAAEDEHKERVNGDPLAESLRAVISMMQIEKRVGKLAGDSAIGGWAKTVASAASKTTANEQSSGGLSLASIGSTPPVDAGGLPLSQREVAYREALVRLHDHYDRRSAFSDDEVKADIQEIREAYADVCYTPAQAEKRRLYKVAEAVVLGMGGQPARQEGMLQLIEKVFEDGDEEDEKVLLDSNFAKLLGRTYL